MSTEFTGIERRLDDPSERLARFQPLKVTPPVIPRSDSDEGIPNDDKASAWSRRPVHGAEVGIASSLANGARSSR